MKIAAVTQSYAPAGGGVRTMLHAQRAWCRARGFAHVLIVPGAEDVCVRDGDHATYEIASPFVPGSRSYRLLLRGSEVRRALRAEQPDVVEVHCTYNLPWVTFRHRRQNGGLVAAVCMTDVAVAYVEAPLARRVGTTGARFARGLAERYLRAVYARCDVTFALSAAHAGRLRRLGVPRVVEIGLGVDARTFAPHRRDPEVRARAFGAQDEDLVLIYAGRLDREKRPDLLVDAVHRLPAALRARLVLVGDGPLRASLAQALRASGRGRVLPFEPDRTRLAALLASADVYVSAMRHETFGLSVLEAQACGLPVVGVDDGAMRDRVGEGLGLLVEPDAPAALAAAIASTPREEWPRMGARARQRVAEAFSWERTFDGMLAAYSGVAGQGTARPSHVG